MGGRRCLCLSFSTFNPYISMGKDQEKEIQKKLDEILTDAERKISELEKSRDVLVANIAEQARIAAVERLKKDISGQSN